jgi:phosphoenolpyruvate carboxykinase (ATP)
MTTSVAEALEVDLGAHGIKPAKVHANWGAAALAEAAVQRHEGILTKYGAFTVITAPHTGRSPKDKFVVKEPDSAPDIWWDNNAELDPGAFDRLHEDIRAHLTGQELFVQDLHGGAAPEYRLGVRFITPNAWSALFVRNMFIRPLLEDLAGFEPGFLVLHAPEYMADPERHGTRTSTVIALNFAKRMILVAGTRYGGELKKSIFTVLNYLLPAQGVLPMHCSANVGEDGETAIFFGLSGTGKTTLSADPTRHLIGDDEHGWSPNGVFNFEGGCYAKVIRLDPEHEPEIYAATQRFGTVLENVTLDPLSRSVDFDSEEITENTRASYPIDFIPNHMPGGVGGHPTDVVFLTADAFGVMPPIARLTAVQAKYHFLSGYTAKVAGTERGVTEPAATFSACFGAPFLPRHPSVYATMLGERIEQHGARVWLVNTGWTGGPYGTGTRMPIAHTRAMVRAALSGALDGVAYSTDPVFGVEIPAQVPGVPADVLQPRTTWANPNQYDAQARKLTQMFAENFKRYMDQVSEAVQKAGPVG